MGEILRAPVGGLPGPMESAFETAMSSLPTLWGRLAIGLENGRDALEVAVVEASRLSDETVEEVRLQGRVASRDEQVSFLRLLVSAWPNASQNDLAGYGLQLSHDVEAQRPSCYALAVASRRLRRASKFLPSISEVLDAVEAADKPMTASLKTLVLIPSALERAKAELAKP